MKHHYALFAFLAVVLVVALSAWGLACIDREESRPPMPTAPQTQESPPPKLTPEELHGCLLRAEGLPPEHQLSVVEDCVADESAD